MIERAGQAPLKLKLDQREDAAPGATVKAPFHSLGAFDFPAGEGAVILSAAEADGFVHVDAVQIVEVK